MKASIPAKPIVLDNLKPLRHSFGLLHQDAIVQKVEWHQHHEYELLYMEKAYGTFLVGDTVFSFNEDNDSDVLLFFGKHLPHSFHYKNDKDSLPSKVSVYSLIFTEDCLGEHFFELPELNKIKAFLHQANRGYFLKGGTKKAISTMLRKLHKQEGVDRLLLFLEILKSLEKSSTLEPISGSPVSPDQDPYPNERIHKTVQFIYRNYHRDLTVSEAARDVHMSPQSFSLYFKETTGQTFLKFVNQLRISKVCEQLLTQEEEDITSIAYNNGFNNLSNFNRRFKQIKKMSPREFRHNWR